MLRFLLESDSESEDNGDEVINIVVTLESIDNLLQQFRNGLTSVDGRHKNERVAFQRSRQILKILKAISSIEYDATDLFNRRLLHDDWLNKLDKVQQPGKTLMVMIISNCF